MIKATVTKSTGSWYEVIDEQGSYLSCRLRGKHRNKNLKFSNPVAVGDKVELLKDENNDLVIDEILERRNYIIRQSPKGRKMKHIIASNLDGALLMATIALPRTSTGFIDRFLVTAEAYQIPTTLVFNKIDVYTDKDTELLNELAHQYEKIGYTVLKVSAEEELGLEDLNSIIKDKTHLIAGHSGVGKSTLLNKIIPDLDQATREISGKHEKGMHTTTFAEMFEIPGGGFIIDTPGIKEFGVLDMEVYELAHYFKEMESLRDQCKFSNCLHIKEPKCAVIEGQKNGEISEFRYKNYLNILDDIKESKDW